MNTLSIPGGSELPWGSAWTFPLIDKYHIEIAKVASEYKLDAYPIQLEMITSEQMMDRYSYVGLPVGYHHWSYGKSFLSTERAYRRGQMGLAYEIVINSDPCIAYLMEENTLTMQALVIAHAAYGHNSFFKGNQLFRQWTDASAVVDYMVFAKNYIAECEERHGYERVEKILDSCHALMNQGVDRYKRPAKRSVAEEKRLQKEREEYQQSQVNDLWARLVPHREVAKTDVERRRFPREPQENILYFIEKSAPFLEPWEREIVRIVRKSAQYFFPQRQTQVMNEGWATYWHYTILNTMYDRGLLADGFMLEFLKSHAGVTWQPEYSSRAYSGINPYALGVRMYTDIRRVCEGGTWIGGEFRPDTREQKKEDALWFPDFVGKPWLDVLDGAMREYKDESFISQFLSPKIMRSMRLFAMHDDTSKKHFEVSAIHDEAGYREVRQRLSDSKNIALIDPDIQVESVDVTGDRTMTLRYTPYRNRELDRTSLEEVVKHAARLWTCPVRLVRAEPRTGVDHQVAIALPDNKGRP
jgi:stage V sporulation protein R